MLLSEIMKGVIIMAMVLLWLLSMIISIFILYWIIVSAINSSELASDIKEIKEILRNQYNHSPINTNNPEVYSSINPKHQPIYEPITEACPACGAIVLMTDRECRSCGLTLIMEDK